MITSFTLDGPHGFLSNFYPAPICASHPFRPQQRGVYATVEHFYQAWKAAESVDHDYVADARTPGLAKSRGRRVRLRTDWEAIKVQVMVAGLTAKFKPGSVLARQLLATGDSQLVEGNDWGDRFWGAEYALVDAATGERAWIGHNHLGRLLVERREELFRYLLTDEEFLATL